MGIEGGADKLIDQKGGSGIRFPLANTEEFWQGVNDYRGLFVHRASADPHTGERFTKGLRIFEGKEYILVPASTPLEYAANVRTFLQSARKFIIGGQLELGPFTMMKALNPNFLATLEKVPPGPEHDYSTIVSIKFQMTGFGKAALDNGDIKTALVAFDTAEGLFNPTIQSRVMEAIRQAIINKRINLSKLIKELEPYHLALHHLGLDVPPGIAAKETRQQTSLEKRPKRAGSVEEPKVIRPGELTNLVPVEHTGTGQVYIVGGPNGRSILKLADVDQRQRARLLHEIEDLKAAKGAGGLPILEGILIDPGYTTPRGILIERIFGESVYQVSLDSQRQLKYEQEFAPARFGLDRRLWLIYDMIEAYQATGVIHGDLFDLKGISAFDGRITGELEADLNADNLMLETGTRRLRMIDYGLDPDRKVGEEIRWAKSELRAAIEFMFMGRAKANTVGSGAPLFPTSPELQKVGQEMIDRLNQVKDAPHLLDMIPPQVRLPGEGH